MKDESEHVRQTAVNTAGRIALADFGAAEPVLERGMRDNHHSVGNGAQGLLRKRSRGTLGR